MPFDHTSLSPENGSDFLSGGRVCGMEHCYRPASAQGFSRYFFDNHGRASFWINSGLVLLIISLSLVVLYHATGISERRNLPMVKSPDKEAATPDRHYKIPMAEVEADYSYTQSADKEAALEGVGGDNATPLPGTAANEIGASKETEGKEKAAAFWTRPAREEDGKKETAMKDGEVSDEKAPAVGKAHPPGATTRPDTEEKVGGSPSSKVGRAPQKKGASNAAKLFVGTQAVNVRKGPSSRSRVKFRLRMGDEVTVTGRRGAWAFVRLDDGRSGWIYRGLLSGFPVKKKLDTSREREIKGIRMDLGAEDRVRVVFELSSPFSPKITLIKGRSPRVVCDFFEATLAPHIGERIEVNRGFLKRIRTGLHNKPRPKVRVVLDLAPGSSYEVEGFPPDEGDRYFLVVRGRGRILP